MAHQVDYMDNPHQRMKLGDDLNALAKAWNDPGPFPIFHEEWKKRLRREWPALANAIEKLVDNPS